MGKLVAWLDRCLLTDLPTGRPCSDVDHLMFVEEAVCARRGFKRQEAVVSSFRKSSVSGIFGADSKASVMNMFPVVFSLLTSNTLTAAPIFRISYISHCLADEAHE